MHAPIRLLVSLVVLSGGLAGIAAIRPAAIGRLGLQWRDAQPGPVRCVRSEETLARCRRGRAKERIIEQLLAGNMSLFDAAAWFAAVNEAPAEFPDLTWQALPGHSAGEKLCRQVIFWARSQMETTLPFSQVEGRVKELESDLERHNA